MATETSIEPGVVIETAIGEVSPSENSYNYRTYPALALAGSRSYEDVWHLLIEGSLPDTPTKAGFRTEVASYRGRASSVLKGLQGMPTYVTPEDGVRILLSLLRSSRPAADPTDSSPSGLRRQCLEVACALPIFVAAVWRHRVGAAPITPAPALDQVSNFLYLLDGTEPAPERVRALSTYLVLTMDHGLAPSTFAVRVIASTGSDAIGAVLGGLSALTGPRHGGAISEVLTMLDVLESGREVDAWLRDRLIGQRSIPGFEHAVYSDDDPRSRVLEQAALRVSRSRAEQARLWEGHLKATLARLAPDRNWRVNSEFYGAVVLESCSIPRELFTLAFSIGRCIGWTAHLLEQAREDGMIRPRARYIGAPVRGRSVDG